MRFRKYSLMLILFWMGCVISGLARQQPAKSEDAAQSSGEAPNPSSFLLPLNNKDILFMIQVGISPVIIVAKIERTPCEFDTSPATLAELKAAGVPDSVVLAMVKAPLAALQEPQGDRKEVARSLPSSSENPNTTKSSERASKTVQAAPVEPSQASLQENSSANISPSPVVPAESAPKETAAAKGAVPEGADQEPVANVPVAGPVTKSQAASQPVASVVPAASADNMPEVAVPALEGNAREFLVSYVSSKRLWQPEKLAKTEKPLAYDDISRSIQHQLAQALETVGLQPVDNLHGGCCSIKLTLQDVTSHAPLVGKTTVELTAIVTVSGRDERVLYTKMYEGEARKSNDYDAASATRDLVKDITSDAGLMKVLREGRA
jgi:hypothetical protein